MNESKRAWSSRLRGRRLWHAASLAIILSVLGTSPCSTARPGGEDRTWGADGRVDCNGNGVDDAQDLIDWGEAFDDPGAWNAYDPSAGGVGVNARGYHGAVSDGQYIYFAPSHNGIDYHGEVLRLDTTQPFGTPVAWATFNPDAAGVGIDPRGFFGCVFDGRHVYFVPHRRGPSSFSDEVMRYDTEASFFDPASWETFDLSNNNVGLLPGGYLGGVFDGRFVYFAPNYYGSYNRGEVLRFDSTGAFGDPAAWETFDPGAAGVGVDPDGYVGGTFDGRYVYFAPLNNGSEWHGEVLRFDTTGDFTAPTAWETFDPGAAGVGETPDGYSGAVFDGRYVYLVPFLSGVSGHHGEVMRYDTQADFSLPGSWEAFDAGEEGLGTDPDGYLEAVFDGRFIYFVPDFNGAGFHSEALRYDTSGLFADLSCWRVFNPHGAGVGSEISYAGGVCEGDFIYFAPNNDGDQHGEVMRYDLAAIGSPDCNENGVPDECDIEDGYSDDCNENGIPDECDIAHALSWDANGNGIPDECEGACPGDLNDDGVVNVSDLLLLLGSWGTNGPGANLAEPFDIVNVGDLLALLACWGDCP